MTLIICRITKVIRKCTNAALIENFLFLKNFENRDKRIEFNTLQLINIVTNNQTH